MSNHNFENEISKAKYTGLHIQEGDVLEITVSAYDLIAVRPFNKSTMNQTSSYRDEVNPTTQSLNNYIVSNDGVISLPVLGDIYCKGMTKKQLKENIEAQLRKYLTDPLVSIKLINFNVNILGEVASPGQKTSTTEKLNIFQALALAGDMTTDANRTNVKIIRSSEENSTDQVFSVDLSDASITNSPYYYLQQNDIVYVEPDKNKQIAVNNNAGVDKWVKYGGFALGLLSLILTLTRLK